MTAFLLSAEQPQHPQAEAHCCLPLDKHCASMGKKVAFMGRLGKDKNPCVLMLGAVLSLASCAESLRDGRYAGAVDTDAGRCGLDASKGRSDGSLLIRGDDAVFAPDGGITVLHGRIDAAGHVTASAITPGADHKPFQMVFDGDLSGARVTGRYATPRCRATVRLDRVS